MPLDPKWSHYRADGSTIRRVIDSLHQSVELQPIGELRDVGPHTAEGASELAQGHRSARLHKRVERLILGRREGDRLEYCLQTLLDVPS